MDQTTCINIRKKSIGFNNMYRNQTTFINIRQNLQDWINDRDGITCINIKENLYKLDKMYKYQTISIGLDKMYRDRTTCISIIGQNLGKDKNRTRTKYIRI